MKAYKNKFKGTCAVTGVVVERDAGWVVFDSKTGDWRVLSEDARVKEGHEPVKSGSPNVQAPPGKALKGAGLGLSVADTLAWVFRKNEEEYASNNEAAVKTDKEISEFMLSEFPNSSIESRSVARIRMHRTSYNASKHSFAGRPKPTTPSAEYVRHPGGSLVRMTATQTKERDGNESGLTEEDVRLIAAEEAEESSKRLEERMAKRERPVVRIEVSGKRRRVKEVDSADRHVAFVDVLKRVEARIPVLLIGPAGCGKSHLAGQVAEALDLKFSFNSMSEGVGEAHLFGRMLPDDGGKWTHRPSPFVSAFRDGGLHLLDEVDAAEPNMLVAINAAIANRSLSLPFAQVEPIAAHEDFVMIAAANTYGNGADRQYVGRNQLDAATVDRFRMGRVLVDYDRKLELRLAEAHAGEGPSSYRFKEMLEWAWLVRDCINRHKMRRIMSTRNIIDGAKMLAVGLTVDDVRKAYFLDWTDDDKAKAVRA